MKAKPKILTVKVSEGTRQLLRERADKVGLKFSVYLRRVLQTEAEKEILERDQTIEV